MAVSPTSNRAVLIDLAAVTGISLALCLTRSSLEWMQAVVPIVLGLRTLAWLRLPACERGPARVELPFFVLCIVLGAFNDWNSVHHHRVYDYTVDVGHPRWSMIPVWMLLFWGMILRLVATLGRWRGLGSWTTPLEKVVFGGRVLRSPHLALLVQLLLVLGTRQAIYRTYLDPIWSWLPFALAACLYLVVLRPHGPALKLMGLALVAGPAIEILYIQVGQLHRYHLGWFGGVPLWIILWWALAIPIWADLSLRLTAWMRVPDAAERGSARGRAGASY